MKFVERQLLRNKKIFVLIFTSAILLMFAFTACEKNRDNSDNSLTPGSAEQIEPDEVSSANKTVQASDTDWVKAYKDFLYEYDAKGKEEYPNIASLGLYNIDGDGIPELILGWWRDYTVYKYKNNEVVEIGGISDRYMGGIYKIPDFKGIYTYGGWGTGVGGSLCFEMIDGTLVDITGEINLSWVFWGVEPPHEGDGYYFNDEKISEDEYNILVDKYFNDINKIQLYYLHNTNDTKEDIINQMFDDYI